MVVVPTYCDSHVARQEKVRSADLRKGFPEVSLPRPQLSYNRPGPAELGPAWLGSATPLLAQEKLGPTGASPPLLSSLTFWSGKFLSISFPPHFLISLDLDFIDPYTALPDTCLPCLVADPRLAGMRCTVGWG